jgi:thiamine biosynthesis lipoprotein
MMALGRLDLRAMNSDIELFCSAADAARRLRRSERWLKAFEARFSRFQPLSELSRLNASAGRPFIASPKLFQLVKTALAAAQAHDGLIDPTVLSHLVAAGYDRSFELIQPVRNAGGGVCGRHFTWRDVSMDLATRTIMLPEGCGIDLGGIGKGFAVDAMAAILGTPCLVNGGGDIYAAGTPPDDTAWRVGIGDPFAAERDLLTLRVVDRGVATSSSLKRRWQVGDAMLHHIIDPRTGGPASSDVVQATVVAETACEADQLAKVALIAGSTEALKRLNRVSATEGVLVLRDGNVVQTDGLAAYL